MGFAFYYQSTEIISPALQAEVTEVAEPLVAGHTWLSCEPLILRDDEGYLSGRSKPNPFPDPDDAASAAAEGLPDGKLSDLLDILCVLSGQFDIDWEISHDYSDGPLGYIRQGHCDEVVRTHCEAIDGVGEDLSEELDEESDEGSDPEDF